MVNRIDRLARSIGDLQDIVRAVRARGASLKATEQPIDTSTAAGKCFGGVTADRSVEDDCDVGDRASDRPADILEMSNSMFNQQDASSTDEAIFQGLAAKEHNSNSPPSARAERLEASVLFLWYWAAPTRQVIGILAFCQFNCLLDSMIEIGLHVVALHALAKKVGPKEFAKWLCVLSKAS
jgi:Resolvase, N terminal domain